MCQPSVIVALKANLVIWRLNILRTLFGHNQSFVWIFVITHPFLIVFLPHFDMGHYPILKRAKSSFFVALKRINLIRTQTFPFFPSHLFHQLVTKFIVIVRP